MQGSSTSLYFQSHQVVSFQEKQRLQKGFHVRRQKQILKIQRRTYHFHERYPSYLESYLII